MKKTYTLLLVIIAFLTLGACQQKTQQQEKTTSEKTIHSTGNFGKEITADGALPATELNNLFRNGDTITTKLTGLINASCKHTGCWMDLDMNSKDVLHVTFKNDGFTIPLDAAGKSAVVQGIAYRKMIPVETLKNYARDDGKSKEEIAAITGPGWEYDFIADGVIIQE